MLFIFRDVAEDDFIGPPIPTSSGSMEADGAEDVTLKPDQEDEEEDNDEV